jgi:hypothetical protein
MENGRWNGRMAMLSCPWNPKSATCDCWSHDFIGLPFEVFRSQGTELEKAEENFFRVYFSTLRVGEFAVDDLRFRLSFVLDRAYTSVKGSATTAKTAL